MEDINIKTKPEKINQKLPASNIVPNKDASEFLEKRAESRKAKTTPSPDTKSQDFGKIILPSESLAKAQKIKESASPKTKSNPLEVSIGILVKGKKKTGNNIITKNSDKNESLSNIFEYISFLKKLIKITTTFGTIVYSFISKSN